MGEKKTPMALQYDELKKEAGEDVLLFFRVGDFYEMFGSDAKAAADILEISLTSRNKNKEDSLPMCGIPYHAAERYIAKLMRAGKKVAIAEQTSPAGEKTIVDRKIVNIITPGTTFSESVLEAKQANYIASIWNEKKTNETSVCFADLTTGDAWVQNFVEFDDGVKELMKKQVVEVIITPDDFREYSSKFSYFSGSTTRHFSPDGTEQFIKDFFKVKTLKSFGIEENTSAQNAVALLFSYVSETQKREMDHCTGVYFKEERDRISLDPDTIKNLELFYSSQGSKKDSLFSHIDYTKTAMGGRMLQENMLSPFTNKQTIDSRLDTITELCDDSILHCAIEKTMSEIADIERIMARVATSRAIPRDFILLKNSLSSLKKLLEEHQNNEGEQWEIWREEVEEIMS